MKRDLRELVSKAIIDTNMNNKKIAEKFDTYYGWHIDHIKPCSLFNLNDEEQIKECFNLENLQPLWGLENIKKSNKYALLV